MTTSEQGKGRFAGRIARGIWRLVRGAFKAIWRAIEFGSRPLRRRLRRSD